ncbi:MAG: ASPIC/UnbV domain-containing protein [Planctomycetota bacterium]
MATTLLEGAEAAPGVEQHPGHDSRPEDFMHPWAREMYRRGFSFNGGERTKVFLSGAGRFADVSDVSQADSPLDGRGLIAADFDDDGDVDLFVHNIQRERHHLYRNELDPAPGTAFLTVDLASDRREPIGATVLVQPEGAAVPTAQALQRGSGYASSQPGRLVFGLGTAPSARVQVRWPWGALEDFGEVAAGSRVLLVEGAGEAAPRARAGAFELVAPLPPGLKLAPGAALPPLVFQDGDGVRARIDPAALTADGPVALEIWASYCRPCVEKLPGLARAHAAGARVVALSVDVPTERDKAKALLARAGAEFPAYYLVLDDAANAGFDDVVDLMRLPVPTTLVIGEGGVLQEVRTGREDAGTGPEGD